MQKANNSCQFSIHAKMKRILLLCKNYSLLDQKRNAIFCISTQKNTYWFFFQHERKKTIEKQKYGILLTQNAVGKSKKGFPDEKPVERGKEKSTYKLLQFQYFVKRFRQKNMLVK